MPNLFRHPLGQTTIQCDLQVRSRIGTGWLNTLLC